MPATVAAPAPPPASYEELATEWSPLIRHLAYRSGVKPGDREDFVQEVMVRFITKDYLSLYDPELGSWRTWFVSIVLKLSYSFRRAQARAYRGVVCSLDQELPGIDGDAGHISDIVGAEDSLLQWVVDHDEYRQFLAWVESLDEELASLFKALVEGAYVGSDGYFHTNTMTEFSRYALAKHLGVSQNKITTLINRLRLAARQQGLYDEYRAIPRPVEDVEAA